MRAYERLLKYVSFSTASSETSGLIPSTKEQFELANYLKNEMQELGICDVILDEKCYVYGRIPATKGYEGAQKIGFIAHMDTSPECSGENVKPCIISDYKGGDITLADGKIIKAAAFKNLDKLIGKTIITTDGTTLLGSDDKSGIAEIMTMAEKIINSNIQHGEIGIAFTPDEEIGAGADYFDVERFGMNYAFTVDGGASNELVYENFNAWHATFDIKGVSVHPGDAKGIMLNASLVAMEINSMLPVNEIPARTSGYEGFYHLCSMKGDIERANLEYIIRDHDMGIMEKRLEVCTEIEKAINEKYGDGTVKLTLKEQYRNMKEMIVPHMHLIDMAVEVMGELGMTADIKPERGGTDGARLSFMGLPCPNLGTGGYGFHGPFEHVCVEEMDMVTDVLTGLVYKAAAGMDSH